MEKRLDADTRAALYKMLPFSMSARVWYTPDDLEFLDEKPRFKIRQLTKKEFGELRKKFKDGSLTDNEMYKLAGKVLYGWEKYREIIEISDNGEVKYGDAVKYTADENGNPTKECVCQLTPQMAGSIVGEAFRISALQEVERSGLT